jgi:hypothetical protein
MSWHQQLPNMLKSRFWNNRPKYWANLLMKFKIKLMRRLRKTSHTNHQHRVLGLVILLNIHHKILIKDIILHTINNRLLLKINKMLPNQQQLISQITTFKLTFTLHQLLYMAQILQIIIHLESLLLIHLTEHTHLIILLGILLKLLTKLSNLIKYLHIKLTHTNKNKILNKPKVMSKLISHQ